ncbi:MAG: GNAT family N-acetyltransferase [Bacteroidota bacterium]
MTIRPLVAGDVEAAAALAARAFHDDPLFVTLHPNAATRDREFAIEHAAYIRRIYRPVGIPEVAEVDGRLAGLALWLPPDGQGSLRWREMACLPALLRAFGLWRLPAALREYGAFDRAFPASGRFHYLGLLAVDPEAQGRGVGSALLRRGLDRADAEGAEAYLETGTEANVGFYARHGFEVEGRIPLPTAPTHWAMRRPPRGGDASA